MSEKYLYETTVKKQVEESIVETREENGEKVEVKRTVKKVKTIPIAILKPDRKLYKAAEIFYARTLAEYLKAGLLPYSLVAKRYANDGGPLPESDKQRLKVLDEESRNLEKDFFKTVGDSSEETQRHKNDLLLRLQKVNEEVSTIQNVYADIYESTAEMKARNDTVEWWSLHLILINEGEGYQVIFGNGSFDEKVAVLETFEDKADPFYNEAIKKLSYLISFWFAAKNTVSKIDFETMEKLYTTTMSDYKVEEEKVEVKVNDVTPPV